MLRAALSSRDVTMFQPIRPPVRWSSVLNLRANKYGASYVVDTVMPKPSRSVAAAIAETASSGSVTGVCTARVSAALASPPKTSSWPTASAMNKASKPPESNSFASSTQYRMSV